MVSMISACTFLLWLRSSPGSVLALRRCPVPPIRFLHHSCFVARLLSVLSISICDVALSSQTAVLTDASRTRELTALGASLFAIVLLWPSADSALLARRSFEALGPWARRRVDPWECVCAEPETVECPEPPEGALSGLAYDLSREGDWAVGTSLAGLQLVLLVALRCLRWMIVPSPARPPLRAAIVRRRYAGRVSL